MELICNKSELNINEKISIIILSLIALLLPIYQKTIPLLIVIWTVQNLFYNFKSFSFISIYRNKTAVLLISFFLLHILTLVITENKSSGLFDIESKLSLLIFPLIFTLNPKPYKKSYLSIFNYFILGCLIAGLICLTHSFYLKIAFDARWQYFTYTDLSILMHPTYFAMYICLAIVLSFNALLISKNNISRLFYIFTILFFMTIVMLLSSKAGLIVLFFLVIIFLFKFIKKNKKNIILILTFSFLMLGLIMKNDRFSVMKDTLYNKYVLGKTQIESTNERLIVWSTVIKKLKTDWLFGTGAGDLKFDLTKEFKKSGFNLGEEKLLNAHNQYLETFLSVGILGIVILLLILIICFKIQYNHNNLELLGFIIIITINFIFESILNNQAGIVFFSLFISFLPFLNRKKKFN